MLPGDLEDIVDRALKELPAPRAPRTLVPRVMAAIDTERLRTSRARPWLSWPAAWQVASIAALVLLAVGTARIWPAVSPLVQQSMPPVFADAATLVSDAAGKVAALANVTRIFWHAFVEPLVGYLLVLVLVMCAACATFGAALGRVALGEVSQT
jgi:hypothetical protein